MSTCPAWIDGEHRYDFTDATCGCGVRRADVEAARAADLRAVAQAVSRRLFNAWGYPQPAALIVRPVFCADYQAYMQREACPTGVQFAEYDAPVLDVVTLARVPAFDPAAYIAEPPLERAPGEMARECACVLCGGTRGGERK